MSENCTEFNKQKIKYNDYKNYKEFTKKPNFHLINFLLIVLNLLSIIYLQISEFKFRFFKSIKKRI